MDTPSVTKSQQVAPGWRAYDLTPHDVAPLLDRFIKSFEPGPPDECWPWRGRTFGATGYGVISRSSRFVRNKHLLAHRVAWVAFTGRALGDQLTIDHLCNNKVCVNPDHLEPVSLHENIRRKNERLGYVIGGKRTGPRTRRSPRPIANDEERAQRARESSARYYREHRDEVRARHRASERESAKEKCPDCGIEVRHDGMRRHRKRMHGLV